MCVCLSLCMYVKRSKQATPRREPPRHQGKRENRICSGNSYIPPPLLSHHPPPLDIRVITAFRRQWTTPASTKAITNTWKSRSGTPQLEWSQPGPCRVVLPESDTSCCAVLPEDLLETLQALDTFCHAVLPEEGAPCHAVLPELDTPCIAVLPEEDTVVLSFRKEEHPVVWSCPRIYLSL